MGAPEIPETPEETEGPRDPRPRPARPRTAATPRRPHRRRPLPAWVLPVAVGAGVAALAFGVFWFAYLGPVRAGLAEARLRYDRGEYAAAATAAEGVLARNSSQMDAVLMLARIKAATGDSAGALELYARVLAQSPNNGVVQYEMASLEQVLGQTAAAVPHFEAALKADPGNTAYLDALVKAEIAAGKARDAAAILLERAGDTSRSSADRAALYVRAAAALMEINADAEAKDALKKALKLVPKDPAAVRMLTGLE